MSDRARDALLYILLFLGTLGYLYLWPRDLYGYDEGLFLYEAKRVLDGEVMYRDFFEILTPGSLYVMALLYALFGVSVETARMGMAVVHGGIAVLVYAICRRMEIRRALAAATAMACLAICYPPLTIASAHWFGTAATLVVFLLVLRPGETAAARVFVWGLATGVLVVVEQQRAPAIAAATLAVLVVDHLLGRRRRGVPAMTTMRLGVWYAGGMVIVAAPVILGFVAAAGFEPVFRALVRYPLDNYRRVVHSVAWGAGYSPMFPGMPGLPILLKYLPAIVLLAAARVVWQWLARRDPTDRRPLLVATIFSACAILAIVYCPDIVHLGLAGPVWFVLVAESLEQLLRRSGGMGRAAQAVAPAVVFALILGLALLLYRNQGIRRTQFPFSDATAFGRVDFGNPDEIDFLKWLTPLLREAGVREIFVFPCYAAAYLYTATSNPTRFQLVLPDYTDRDQIEEIIATLEARKVPFVIENFFFGVARLTSLRDYVRRHYEPVRIPGRSTFPVLTLYRRRSASPPGR